MVDPEVVDLAIERGVGRTISVSLGGKINKMFCHPVKVTARIKSISDGLFKLKGPMLTGVQSSMGRTVVLVVGKVYIVVMEHSTWTFDLVLYRSVGLEPNDAHIVVVKSSLAQNAGKFFKRVIPLDTPGSNSARLTTLPFKHITRPCYPFDDVEEYECKEEA